MVKKFVLIGVVLLANALSYAGAKDVPFLQAVSVKFETKPELHGAEMRKVVVDRDGIAYVLTSRGVARLFGDVLALDRSHRPLTGRKPLDISLADGGMVYLLEDEVFSPRRAGKYFVNFPTNSFSTAAFRGWWDGFLAGKGKVLWTQRGTLEQTEIPISAGVKAFANEKQFVLVDQGKVWRTEGRDFKELKVDGDASTAAFFENQLFVGTTNAGIFGFDASGKEIYRSGTRIPAWEITSLLPMKDGIWAGTKQGVFWRSKEGENRYYAGKRWLDNDEIVSLAKDEDGHVLALSKKGLNKIELRLMTLAEKAKWYDDKIRKRHIRYGFSAELHMSVPGDPTTAAMIDTDNDGTWSNYYMASQAFRFGATGDEEAHRNAWETFEAMERLEEINPLEGFPSRTFERAGFESSDVDRWHNAPDKRWNWKAHTSSDEIIAHAFGSSALYEAAARTSQEKQRIANFIGKITDHIIRNNWYLVDVDGKPTLWGRWHPEYVNWFPHSIVDRRLNSAEIIGLLQFAYRITGKEVYREKGMELIEQHGFLENITSPMKLIAETKGYIHEGHDMGDTWNHSDDLLAFDSYWVLWRYAFNEELKRKYAAAIADHWEIEKDERNPLWSFVYASTGAKEHDLEGALWTLRGFPLDMVDWTMRNSHRKDLTLLPKNFRNKQSEELLHPGERRMTRWNTSPYALDAGSGGRQEFAGDEFLLPYWMGRYLNVIDGDARKKSD